MRAWIVAAAIIVWGSSQISWAQSTGTITRPVSGHTYFNSPGATLEQQREDLERCGFLIASMSEWAIAVPVPGFPLTSVSAAYGVNEGASGVARRRNRAANVENCMIARGWRVVQIDDQQRGQRLQRASRAILTEWLGANVGADAPEGRIARVFANEVSASDSFVVGAAGPYDEVSLSLLALPADSPGARAPRQSNRGARATPSPIAALSLAELAGLAPDASLVIVQVRAPAYAEVTIEFARVDSALAGGGRFVVAMPGASSSAELVEITQVFRLAPGEWRIERLVRGNFATTFCLGAPKLSVSTGEVVFAGSFGFGGAARGPTFALEPIRNVLASSPALSERVRPATYVNGETFACEFANLMYAYEIDGAPFRLGYAWGSQADASQRQEEAPQRSPQ